jgi:thymidylate synthase (FAD)
MQVNLMAKTQGVGELAGKSVGEILAYVARVSNPTNQNNDKTSARLLTYCLRQGHWSVFESASLTMEIVTSRAIAQQILRHRSFTFQEFSQRYAEAVDFEVYEARRQDTKNRQNSIDDMPIGVKEWFNVLQKNTNQEQMDRYKRAIEAGIAKEQARFLLPLSTQTRLYMTGNVRSWITYCQSRIKPGVQLEHKEIAKRCLGLLLQEVPELHEFLAEEFNHQ